MATRGSLSDDAFQMAQLHAAFAAEGRLVPTFEDGVRLRRLLDAFVASSYAGQRLVWNADP